MNLDGCVIYQIFPRNYSKEGTFKEIKNDLNRIKDLGVDIIYLMPINEVGQVSHKGTYGSPYAIKDYYSISKDLGTKEDLKALIKATHKLGMKIIVDMVFHHTSPDSVLTDNHIEFYLLNEENMPYNRVLDWDDVIDLDLNLKETQDYLIDVLKYYKKMGFDGFRFDVASLIPIEFFYKAKLALGGETIFFAESVDNDFKKYLKRIGHPYEEDENLFPTFDILYNYNYFFELKDYLLNKNKESLREAIRAINKEATLHNEIIRANCLENHDNNRIASLVNEQLLTNLLTMFTLLRGSAFIYAGEEYANTHRPELFEKDPVDWDYKNEDVENLVKELIELKKDFGDVETQFIEEIGELLVFKVTLRNKEGDERILLVNLNDHPISIKKIIKENYDPTLETVITEKVMDEKLSELTYPLIITLLKKNKEQA